ncbi:MAG: hypothetical protein F4X97_07835 [Boseongicola sp. SB0662_bin_57]|nr:hypothetical protein [Boseongicola sp. SB0662_bin_57]
MGNSARHNNGMWLLRANAATKSVPATSVRFIPLRLQELSLPDTGCLLEAEHVAFVRAFDAEGNAFWLHMPSAGISSLVPTLHFRQKRNSAGQIFLAK